MALQQTSGFSDVKGCLDRAKELGFSEAVFLSGLSIECRPELRAYCNPEQCPKHGQNWVCPPGCGTLEECREKVRDFSEGILLQSITGLTPPTEPEVYRGLNREHNLRFRELIESAGPGFARVLPLTSGGCIFCGECSFPKPCIKPDVKMESLSAFGIDVGSLCAKAELPYSFSDEVVYMTALLLVKI